MEDEAEQSSQSDHSSQSDDMKAKFREALERKKRDQKSRPAHLDGGSAIHGTQGKAGGKRVFRRKSG